MPKRYEYRVCLVQDARVSGVNGKWNGKMAPSPDHAAEALKTCPAEWDYLAAAGEDGWKLVAAVGSVGDKVNAKTLYLRREKQ
jgi:hypothetical protein